MCFILGAILPNVDEYKIHLLNRLLLEGSIRGLHATGAAWLEGNTIKLDSQPKPAAELNFDFVNCVDYDGYIRVIVHCRYSTSDLEYNQPIEVNGTAIVHNGVITQEMPENWETLYGLRCVTKNDTELLLRSYGDVIDKWRESSISAIELRVNGVMRAYRNGKRPLHYIEYYDGIIFASTKDIMVRAGLPAANIESLDAFYYLSIDKQENVLYYPSAYIGEDLQP